MRIGTAAASATAEFGGCAPGVDSSPLSVSLVPSEQGKVPLADLSGQANSADSPGSSNEPRHPVSRLGIVEGGLALTVLYALIGAGIGALAGSFLLGLVVGFATGVAAIGAILLISGASVVPERAMERVVSAFPRQVFRS